MDLHLLSPPLALTCVSNMSGKMTRQYESQTELVSLVRMSHKLTTYFSLHEVNTYLRFFKLNLLSF